MAALPFPHPDDVIIRRDASGSFTLDASSGTPQIACGTFDEALQRAISFANRQHVRLWLTADGLKFAPLIYEKLLRRIWNEYVEMPGLRLTRHQAQRLWSVDADTCKTLLESLVDLKVLVRGADGMYGRSTEATEAVSPLRMAKAEAGARPPAGKLPYAG